MPSRRDLKLDQYNIDKYQYRELHNFCLQYGRKKQQAASLIGIMAVNNNGMPSGNNTSDTVAKQAALREQLLRDCELIEQTAVEVDGIWYQQLLLGVTEDVPWRHLRLLKNLGLNEKEYGDKRRKFYYLLAVKKNMI